MDLIFISIGLIFFIANVLFIQFSDQLKGGDV